MIQELGAVQLSRIRWNHVRHQLEPIRKASPEVAQAPDLGLPKSSS